MAWEVTQFDKDLPRSGVSGRYPRLPGSAVVSRPWSVQDVLDRKMPGRSGDDVLAPIEERGIDCCVVLVTAVDPGFDVMDLPCDNYLVKPVSRSEVEAAVDDMLERDRYDEQFQRYFALASKKAVLESKKHAAELDVSEEYHEISQRVEQRRAEVDAAADDVEDVTSVLRDLPAVS